MLRFLKKIYLEMYPPQPGDVFYRNWLDFANLSDIRKGLYGFKPSDDEWSFFPGDESYRFTITSDGMPYYICKIEILVCKSETSGTYWLENNPHMPARIGKKDFIDMVVNGRMVKSEKLLNEAHHGKAETCRMEEAGSPASDK